MYCPVFDFLPSVARFVVLRSLLLTVVDDRIRCFASLQHDSAMIIPYGFVISSERSDERSLLLTVVEMTKRYV